MSSGRKLNPFVLFLKILFIMAGAEFIVMVVLSVMNFREGVVQFLADSLLLSMLSAPFLYYFVVKVVSKSIRTEAKFNQEAIERDLINKALIEKVALKQYSEDIVKSVSSSIMVISENHMVLLANPSSSRLLNKDEIIGRQIKDVLADAGLNEAINDVFVTGKASKDFILEIMDGEKSKFLQANIAIIQSSEPGNEVHALLVIDDITGRKENEQIIFKMAYYDALTGLPNRLLLTDRISQALASAGRNGCSVAVLFLDIDRFKFVNDTLGHEAGDELLKIVAEKLRMCLRLTDTVARLLNKDCLDAPSIESTVGRLGGDEFIILLPDLPKDANVINIANRVLASLDAPVSIKGYELFITTSIGVSVFPLDGDSVDELLKKADMSMYWAKEEGRNNCKMFNSDLDARRKDWLMLEYKLRKAIEQNEFVLYYQPQINISTGKIIGFECLIRWQDPETELIPPDRFIPIAEENGLIIPITSWVLRNGCAQANVWRLKGYKDVRFSVNISMRQFKDREFVTTLTNILKETGLPPECLEIELTESVIMINAEQTIKILQELKELGLRLTIDDFGTGFSSLSYLKSMPIDVLKIDRSFVRDIPLDQDDIAITTAIINMAHSLDIEVIAEGVETKEQFELLKTLGCDNIQGYLFMKPSTALEAEDFMEKWKPLAIA